MKSIWNAFSLVALCLAPSAFSQAPALAVQILPGSKLQLSWSQTADALVLERTFQLLPIPQWQSVNATPVLIGGRLQVEIPTSANTEFFRLRGAPGPALTSVVRATPGAGESGVSVQRETIVEFSAPLRSDAVVSPDTFFATFAGRRILSRLELSADRRTATLFYQEPLPRGSRVQVELNGDLLRDEASRLVDADGDGLSGGVRRWSFDTVNTVGIAGTGVSGHVYDSARVPAPGGGTQNKPLEGVIITVDGAEETLRTTTDLNGFFLLSPCPAGRFFVHIDGRTADGSDWPDGAYYTFVGKTFEAVAGRTNALAGGTGEIFLPLIPADALRPVSAVQPTTIEFPASVLAQNPAFAGVRISVPANGLFDDSGNRGGRVGLAPVPPDRIPSPLPPGLNFPLVITVQTDGPSNFDQPVPARFPNLPDPLTGVKLPAGGHSGLWSFNHDTGRWELQGPMTVSADGNYVESDPGTGIRQPGWHGSFPGSTGGGGGGGGGPCDSEQQAFEEALFGCAWGIGVGLLELAPAIGCGASIASTAISISQDCSNPNQGCTGAVIYDLFFGAAGCIPGPIGTTLGVAQCIFELGSASGDLLACQLQNQPPNSELAPSARPARPAADDNPTALQEELGESVTSLQTAVLGDARWLSAAAADPANLTAFAIALVAALDPNSEMGRRISPAEQAQILALPAPGGLDSETRLALIQRMDRFAAGGMTVSESQSIAARGNALASIIAQRQAIGWRTMLDGFFATLDQTYQSIDASYRAGSGNTAARRVARLAAAGDTEGLHKRKLYYQLVDATNGAVRRGETQDDGTFGEFPQGLALTADRTYLLTYLDPVTLEQGSTYFAAGSAGSTIDVRRARLTLVPGADTDQDGLTDQIERILGSDPRKGDTDGDGVNDFAQLKSGRSPVSGLSPAQGVVAALKLSGQAFALQVAGSTGYVATGNLGLATVDLADPLAPIFQGQIDLPGESRDIAVVPEVGVAALAALPDHVVPAEPGYLHFVDISNPTQPLLRQSLLLPALAVDASEGLIYAALDREVRIYDPRSQVEVGWFATQAQITGLRVTGGRAYVTTSSALEIHDIDARPITRLGLKAGSFSSELLGRVQLVLDGTTLFVAKAQGMLTMDVSNPAAPVVLAEQTTTRPATRSVVLDGGGNAVVLGLGTSQGNIGAAGFLSVYDVSDPRKLEQFSFSILPPRRGYELGMASGLVISADGLDGLTIVNHLGADILGQPPAVTLDLNSQDRDTGRSGIQVPEGSRLRLAPKIEDDLLLLQTELLHDGVVVETRRDYPAVFDSIMPALRNLSGQSNLSVQIRATDRSGNRTTIAPVLVELTADTQAPVILQSIPANGGAVDLSSALLFRFNELLDPAALNSSAITLTGLGADNLLGTADDVLIPLTARINGQDLALVPASVQISGKYQATVAAGAVADFAGNRTGSAVSVSFDRLLAPPGAALWISDSDGRFRAASNWLAQRVPDREDVWIERPGHLPVVTFEQLELQRSLTAATPLTFLARSGLTLFGPWMSREAVTATDANLSLPSSNRFEKSLSLTGGSLGTEGRLEVLGPLSLARGAQLVLSGPAAQLLTPGGLVLSNSTIRIDSGATQELTLPATFVLPGDFVPLFPVGGGFSVSVGRFRLNGMTAADGPHGSNFRGAPSLTFLAESGRLELPVLTQLSGRTSLRAIGLGGVVDAPLLVSVSGPDPNFVSLVEAGDGGDVQAPLLHDVNAGRVNLHDDGILHATALALGVDGSIQGDGQLTGSLTLNAGGRVQLDRPNAPLKIGGGLNLNPDSTFVTTLGVGLNRTFAGRMAVTGTVALGGQLQVVLANGSNPAVGQEFEILTATGAITGNFTGINDTALGATRKAEVIIAAGSVRVKIASR